MVHHASRKVSFKKFINLIILFFGLKRNAKQKEVKIEEEEKKRKEESRRYLIRFLRNILKTISYVFLLYLPPPFFFLLFLLK